MEHSYEVGDLVRLQAPYDSDLRLGVKAGDVGVVVEKSPTGGVFVCFNPIARVTNTWGSAARLLISPEQKMEVVHVNG